MGIWATLDRKASKCLGKKGSWVLEECKIQLDLEEHETAKSAAGPWADGCAATALWSLLVSARQLEGSLCPFSRGGLMLWLYTCCVQQPRTWAVGQKWSEVWWGLLFCWVGSAPDFPKWVARRTGLLLQYLQALGYMVKMKKIPQ